MISKIVGAGTTIIFALLILSVSFLKLTSIKYAYNANDPATKITGEEIVNIDYDLIYHGKINPDHPLWYAKALRDKMWLVLTFDKAKQMETNLLMADKRLGSALYLFQNDKPDLGLATLTKSAKYLEKSFEVNEDVGIEEYQKIALASLKHRQIITQEILPISPNDLKPDVIKSADYAVETYKKSRDYLLSKGAEVPSNPFE